MRPALLGFDNIGLAELAVVGLAALLVFRRQVGEVARECLQRLLR